MRQIANLLTGVYPRPRVRIPPCPPILLFALLTLLLATTPGCVTRTLRLRSEPAGATVHLDGRAVGTTPYVEEFQSYGVRRLELRLPGHRRLVTDIDVWRPWWQNLPFAIFTDVLWPFEIRDERAFDFVLLPLAPDSSDWDDAQRAYERMHAHKRRAFGDADTAPTPDVDAPVAAPAPDADVAAPAPDAEGGAAAAPSPTDASGG